MADFESSNEIQARMAKLRRGIRYQVRAAAHDAKDWFNWKQLIARHPFASIGLAAAIGFALVPRRQRKELQTLSAPNGQVRLEETLRPKIQPAKFSFVGSLLRSAISAGFTIVLNRTIRSLTERAANPERDNRQKTFSKRHSEL